MDLKVPSASEVPSLAKTLPRTNVFRCSSNVARRVQHRAQKVAA